MMMMMVDDDLRDRRDKAGQDRSYDLVDRKPLLLGSPFDQSFEERMKLS
jgi:hypothetical protein